VRTRTARLEVIEPPVIHPATNWAAEPMYRALASHRLSVIDKLTRRRSGSALARAAT